MGDLCQQPRIGEGKLFFLPHSIVPDSVSTCKLGPSSPPLASPEYYQFYWPKCQEKTWKQDLWYVHVFLQDWPSSNGQFLTLLGSIPLFERNRSLLQEQRVQRHLTIHEIWGHQLKCPFFIFFLCPRTPSFPSGVLYSVWKNCYFTRKP